MSMQLTILCDNSVRARPGLIGEHGFACHIATHNKQYLFDTGNGLGLLNNARTCGIDLKSIDAVLLSHGHWDHCGGLMDLLGLRNDQVTPVYAHPAMFDHKVSADPNRTRNIGCGFRRLQAEAAGAIFHFSTAPVKLPGGLIFSGEIPKKLDQTSDDNLCHISAGSLLCDPLLDDQSLYLLSDSGLVVLCGCAHSGVRNILAHSLSLTNNAKIHALIGGLHLAFNDTEQNQTILSDLLGYQVQHLALSHCTGQDAITEFKNSLGRTVTSGSVGSKFSF